MSRVAVEVRRTFTDVVVQGECGPTVGTKVLSSSSLRQPTLGVATGTREAWPVAGKHLADHVTSIVYDAPVAAKTLLERTGARRELVATRVCRDTLETLCLSWLPALLDDLQNPLPELVVPRRLLLEIDRRIERRDLASRRPNLRDVCLSRYSLAEATASRSTRAAHTDDHGTCPLGSRGQGGSL